MRFKPEPGSLLDSRLNRRKADVKTVCKERDLFSSILVSKWEVYALSWNPEILYFEAYGVEGHAEDSIAGAKLVIHCALVRDW